MSDVIPVIHCFDNRYVIPAAVAFYSMLKYADSSFKYDLIVLHSDISEENQKKLGWVVSKFSNASLTFFDMKDKFSELFQQTVAKNHYSKEMYYKFLIPEMFPQYDKAIITDVDVLYRGDISKEFENFNVNDDYYIGGISYPQYPINTFLFGYIEKTYSKEFSREEIKKLLIGAGYMFYNLKKMRENNLQKEFISCAIANSYRLKQPEQDCLNLVCYPKIKKLPINTMVCTYLYDFNPDFCETGEWKGIFDNPVQIHYATGKKPWNTLDCTKAHLWFEDLCQTNFFYDFMSVINKTLNPENINKTLKPEKKNLKLAIKKIMPKKLWNFLKMVKSIFKKN